MFALFKSLLKVLLFSIYLLIIKNLAWYAIGYTLHYLIGYNIPVGVYLPIVGYEILYVIFGYLGYALIYVQIHKRCNRRVTMIYSIISLILIIVLFYGLDLLLDEYYLHFIVHWLATIPLIFFSKYYWDKQARGDLEFD